MERFKIESKDLLQFYGEEATLSQVFGDIEKELDAKNCVVCQYFINGEAIPEMEEISYSDWKISQVQTLEYLSEDSDQLVVDVLQSWVDALPELIEKTEKISEDLRFNPQAKTLNSLVTLFENCEFLVQSIIPLKVYIPASSAAGLEMVNEADQKTTQTLQEAIVSFEKKDFNLLADIIEYDLISALQSWEKVLTMIKATFKQGKDIESRRESQEKQIPDPVGSKE